MQNKSLRQTKLTFSSSSSGKEDSSSKRKLDHTELDLEDQGPETKMATSRGWGSSQGNSSYTGKKLYSSVAAGSSSNNTRPYPSKSSASNSYSGQDDVSNPTGEVKAGGFGRGRGTTMQTPGNLRTSKGIRDDTDREDQESQEFKKMSHDQEDNDSLVSKSGDDDSDAEDENQGSQKPRKVSDDIDNEDADLDDGNAPVKKNIEKDKAGSSMENEGNWKGTPISELRSAPSCLKKKLPDLKYADDHCVLFDVSSRGRKNVVYDPFPPSYRDQWDDKHVYMPCSYKNQVPSSTGEGLQSRWKQITTALEKKIPGVFELEEAILSYNHHYRKKWNFSALHRYFLEEVKEVERLKFFNETLPKMQKLALRLEETCTRAIPLLKQGSSKKITMSQEQASCLLANAFFCTFPRRNFKVRGSSLPDINFSNLFSESRASRKVEKLKCIFHYFERVTTEVPTGTLTFARQCVDNFPDWGRSNVKFTNLYVSTKGTIEDDGKGMLQADFANKYIGGGVLGHGLVQEEIRFMICPEMIVSRLFTEVLGKNEVLIMTGCERFSNYTGYSESFKFDGNYVDKTERDAWGRMYTEVVAMDALVIRYNANQFDKDSVMREMNKAYAAFKDCRGEENPPAVCTGNWGCGAFGGDKELKALIQMAAAAVAKREICYFTFGDEDLCSRIAQIHEMLIKDNVSVRSAMETIRDYLQKVLKGYHQSFKSQTLFEFFASTLGYKLKDHKPRRQLSNNSQNDDPWDSQDYKANTP